MNFVRPKNVKYTKSQKKRILRTPSKRNSSLNFGIVGVKALEAGKITHNEIESFRRTITNNTKRRVKIWINIFPHTPLTFKGVGMRMGKGKGQVKNYVARIREGNILFELNGQNINLIESSAIKAMKKISLKTKLIFLKETLL